MTVARPELLDAGSSAARAAGNPPTLGWAGRVLRRVRSLLAQGKKRFEPRGPVYMFLPINGAGLGHLTRCLAIARQLRSRQPEAQVIFVTTSSAVAIVQQFGFICHHVSPFSLCALEHGEWNRLLADSVQLLMRLYRPSVFVFDGSVPYAGLRQLIRRHRAVRFVWVRRQGYKASVDAAALARYERLFAQVLLPGEPRGERARDVAGHVRQLSPVLLLQRHELLTPAQAASRLGVSATFEAGQRFVYVQLGAGNINDTNSLLHSITTALARRGFSVILGVSPIALGAMPPLGSVLRLTDYPNSRYFSLFDFAVLAGGYNSVCEAVGIGLPAIFVPNTATAADDQLARARASLPLGTYEVADGAAATFELSLDRLLARLQQSRPSRSGTFNGAEQAAEALLALAVAGRSAT